MRLALRVRPGASRTAILGIDADRVVHLAVAAPPEDGKANAAVMTLLAKTWRAPKSAISIVRGASARIKLLEIEGNLDAQIQIWIDGLPLI